MRSNRRAVTFLFVIGVAGVSVQGLVGLGSSTVPATGSFSVCKSARSLVVPVQTPDVLVYFAASSSAPTPYA
jgi:hypothetical protein